MSSSLYASVHESPLTVCFVYFCALSSAENLTVRMPTLSQLFILVFLLLLALESLSLSRIVMLVLNHTPMIYVVVLFLYIGVNLCVTKLLLLPAYLTTHKQRKGRLCKHPCISTVKGSQSSFLTAYQQISYSSHYTFYLPFQIERIQI